MAFNNGNNNSTPLDVCNGNMSSLDVGMDENEIVICFNSAVMSHNGIGSVSNLVDERIFVNRNCTESGSQKSQEYYLPEYKRTEMEIVMRWIPNRFAKVPSWLDKSINFVNGKNSGFQFHWNLLRSLRKYNSKDTSVVS